jgi:hypothetical protein
MSNHTFSHPVLRLRDIAQRVIETAAVAYQGGTINRRYWEQFLGGSQNNLAVNEDNPSAMNSLRCEAINRLLRPIWDAGINQLSDDKLWTVLNVNAGELTTIAHDLIWNFGQAAATPFPSDKEPPRSIDEHYVQSVQRYLRGAKARLDQLQPYLTIIESRERRVSLEVDTREVPIDAPAGTPSPLREAYDAVRAAINRAAELRREPSSARPVFEIQARSLSDAFREAHERYRQAETLLQAVVPEGSRCAHQDAVDVACLVNDAAGHVMLGTVPFTNAVAYILALPPFDLPDLLRAMRRQVSRAVILTRTNVVSNPGIPTNDENRDADQANPESRDQKTPPKENDKIPAEFLELFRFANDGGFRLMTRRVVEHLCERGGRSKLADVAAVAQWTGGLKNGFENLRKRSQPRLSSKGWWLHRDDQTVILERLPSNYSKRQPSKRPTKKRKRPAKEPR